MEVGSFGIYVWFLGGRVDCTTNFNWYSSIMAILSSPANSGQLTDLDEEKPCLMVSSKECYFFRWVALRTNKVPSAVAVVAGTRSSRRLTSCLFISFHLFCYWIFGVWSFLWNCCGQVLVSVL